MAGMLTIVMSKRDPGGKASGSLGRIMPASSTLASMVVFISGLYSRSKGPSNTK